MRLCSCTLCWRRHSWACILGSRLSSSGRASAPRPKSRPVPVAGHRSHSHSTSLSQTLAHGSQSFCMMLLVSVSHKGLTPTASLGASVEDHHLCVIADMAQVEERRQRLIKSFCAKAPVYENCRMLSHDVVPLSFIDYRKLTWYEVSSCPRLKFCLLCLLACALMWRKYSCLCALFITVYTLLSC